MIMKGYRIIFECYDKSATNSTSSRTVLMEGGKRNKNSDNELKIV